jgi:hypothetical protein
MVRTLLLYVAVCAIRVAVFWLAGRLLGLSRPSRGPTGRAWLDAEDAFDQARRKQQRHRAAAALHGNPHRLDLPTLKEAAPLGLGGPRNAGEQEILLRDIVGATDGADGKFDRDFLPTDERSRRRFRAIAMALREGRELPPIEVYRLHGHYYVSDGHHRGRRRGRPGARPAVHRSLRDRDPRMTLPRPVRCDPTPTCSRQRPLPYQADAGLKPRTCCCLQVGS